MEYKQFPNNHKNSNTHSCKLDRSFHDEVPLGPSRSGGGGRGVIDVRCAASVDSGRHRVSPNIMVPCVGAAVAHIVNAIRRVVSVIVGGIVDGRVVVVVVGGCIAWLRAETFGAEGSLQPSCRG